MRLQVNLSNRWATFINKYPDELSDFFSYRPAGYYFMMRFRPGWDGKVRLIRNRRIQSGCFLAMLPELRKKYPLDLEMDDLRRYPKFKKGDKSDRAYQNECVNAMVKASNVGGLIINATGTGKTRIAGMYFQRLDGYGVFIVDELTLLAQARAELSEFLGEKVGIIGDTKFRPRRITVATIQTLHKHRLDKDYDKWRKKLEVIFIDEIHLALNRRNLNTVSRINVKAIFGLTATLELNKKDVRLRATALAGPVIYEYPLAKGVKEKYLTPGVVVGVDVIEDVPDMKMNYWDLYDLMVADNRVWNEMIARLVEVGYEKGKHILVIVERVAHLKRLSRRLKHIPHKLAFGEVKVRERVRAKRDFDRNKIRLIICNKVFKKGVSINAIDVMIDGASLRSKNDARQKYGRGVRLCLDKYGLIYFDLGYKNPKGVTRDDPNWNRFARNARSRRAAFRKSGTKVIAAEWKKNPKKIYRQAEEAMQEVLDNIRAQRKGRERSTR